MPGLADAHLDSQSALESLHPARAGTPGKSGSLFFFSHDMRFIVKTLPKREVGARGEEAGSPFPSAR